MFTFSNIFKFIKQINKFNVFDDVVVIIIDDDGHITYY